MDFSLFETLGFGGTGLAVTLGVLRLFWNADDAFSPDFRKALTVRLQNIRIRGYEVEWPSAFVSLFDTIFTSRHFSLSCFCRSTIATVIILPASSLASLIVSPLELKLINPIGACQIFFLLTLPVNIIADYISLLETRFLLGLAVRLNYRWRSTALIPIDLLASTFVWLASFIAVTALLSRSSHLIPSHNLYDGGGIFVQSSAVIHLIGIPTYETSLMTSVWIWLFLAGWLVIRLGSYFKSGLNILQWALPIEEKPMRSIGEVAALLTGLGFGAIFILSGW